MRTLFLSLIICLFALPAQAKYSGGIGEPNDPYQIATVEDLMLLGDSPEDYDKHFILTADIDLDPNLPGRKVFDKAVIAADMNDTNWVFDGASFTGVFDGNAHEIRNLRIQGVGYLGLFGLLGSGGAVFNLSLEAADVDGSRYRVGSLAGHNGGSITNGHSSGTVTGDAWAGGLVGYNSGSIVASRSSGTVTGDASGGLVGCNSGNIIASYSTVTVSGNESVGGLVGRNNGSIVTSYSAGPISGNSHIGGLVGSDQERLGITTASFWDTEVSGQSKSEGGTGLTTVEMQDANTFIIAGWDIVDETLNGTSDYWHLSQGDYPDLSYFAATSPVMPEGLGTSQQPYLIRDARDLGTVWFRPTACYRLEASVDLSGITWSMAVIPWFGGDFDGNGNMVSNFHVEGSRFLGLFGELGSGAKIHNLDLEAVDVNGMREYVEGLEWYVMGYVGGLAGFNSEGIITNSHCTGIILGTFPVGGLVGWNSEGIIANCYSHGTVNGIGFVGGLVGFNSGGTVTSSKSTGVVNGDSRVGGLVGENNDSGSIANNYSTATVNGDYGIGGLVGRNSFVGPSTISYCYSAGKVTGNISVGGLVGEGSASTDVINCFWDKDIVGFITGISGKPVTTTEMQTATTFLDAGWDFVGEAENGTEDIWWILEGKDYPRLWWEADNN